MSWHDPARTGESQADTALRNELRGLLGIPARPANYFETEVTPELTRLADDLRREARRRNHTARRQHSWRMLAAALPLTVLLGAVGAWGTAQKHKAEVLAAAVTRQDAEIQRLAVAASHQAPAPAQPALAQAAAPASLAKGRPAPLVAGTSRESKPVQLVIPVDRATDPSQSGAPQQVKAH